MGVRGWRGGTAQHPQPGVCPGSTGGLKDAPGSGQEVCVFAQPQLCLLRDWERLFEAAVLPLCPQLPAYTSQNPRDLGNRAGHRPPSWDGAFLRLGLGVRPLCEHPCIAGSFPYLTLAWAGSAGLGQDLCAGSPGGPGDVWCHQQRGCAVGMSLQANGTRMAALQLLSLPQLQAIPRSPRLIPGF